jgi:hypothetical protein
MTVGELRILLRIEAEFVDFLEELRNVIAAGLIDVQHEQPKPRSQNSLVRSLNAPG